MAIWQTVKYLALGAIIVFADGCGLKVSTPDVEARLGQVSVSEMLERADKVVLGRIESVRHIGDKYRSRDLLDRVVTLQRVSIVVFVTAILVDDGVGPPEPSDGRLEFVFIENVARDGGVILGPETHVSPGFALVPIRREGAHWRSVVDSWRPVVPLEEMAGGLPRIQRSDSASEILRKFLLSEPKEGRKWTAPPEVADILAYVLGADEAVRSLRTTATEPKTMSCSVCLYLAMRFPGQYRCLNEMLRGVRCSSEEKKSAQAIVVRRELETTSALWAIRSRNREYLISAARAKKLTEAIAVYCMHDDIGVRLAAGAWRAEIEAQ